MHHDAIIFDIDGTLWNACPASADGWNTGLAKLGIDKRISSMQIESVAGNPYEGCIDILLHGLMAKIPGLLKTIDESEAEAVKSRGGVFYDGVIRGIKELAKKYKLFLVSNCQEWYLNLFLDFSGIKPVLTGFDCYGISGVNKSEMLLRLKNNYSLHNPVYIGDTANDEIAAKTAQIDFIYASWGFGGPKQVTKTVKSFTELVDYFRK
jgi:phosphoglycolate phosphatase